MTGVELRRFVGGPFPNLPDLSSATAANGPRDGLVGGPYANLWPSRLAPAEPERGADDLPSAPSAPPVPA